MVWNIILCICSNCNKIVILFIWNYILHFVIWVVFIRSDIWSSPGKKKHTAGCKVVKRHFEHITCFSCHPLTCSCEAPQAWSLLDEPTLMRTIPLFALLIAFTLQCHSLTHLQHRNVPCHVRISLLFEDERCVSVSLIAFSDMEVVNRIDISSKCLVLGNIW